MFILSIATGQSAATQKKIENTEGIEVRLCDECNPNIEVMNEYVEARKPNRSMKKHI